MVLQTPEWLGGGETTSAPGLRLCSCTLACGFSGSRRGGQVRGRVGLGASLPLPATSLGGRLCAWGGGVCDFFPNLPPTPHPPPSSWGSRYSRHIRSRHTLSLASLCRAALVSGVLEDPGGGEQAMWLGTAMGFWAQSSRLYVQLAPPQPQLLPFCLPLPPHCLSSSSAPSFLLPGAGSGPLSAPRCRGAGEGVSLGRGGQGTWWLQLAMWPTLSPVRSLEDGGG